MFLNQFMRFLKSIHTFRRKTVQLQEGYVLFWHSIKGFLIKKKSLKGKILVKGFFLFLVFFSPFFSPQMASSCFNSFRLRKPKNKPLSIPSSSSRTQLNNTEIDNMERKRFDSLESWSMILESENVETWEASKEDQEEWTADLSQLFIGNKFASGAHSRIYRGIYKQRAVAVKMVRIPTHREETRAKLEQQFKSEVALLSRLYHPNIVQVYSLFSWFI